MNIVQPYARLERINGQVPSAEAGLSALRWIEWCGRISHRSEEAQTPDSWKRFIEAVVMGHGDWSIVEHATATVDAVVDRGITHEWVRHRRFSFTQESTRFVNYEKKMPASFIQPDVLYGDDQFAWEWAIEQSEESYRRLIKAGLPPQIARSVFPNALASRIVTTGNLRVWRHFFIMRTCKEAHPQMRQVTIPLLDEFKKFIPLIFDDIEPGQKQVEGMRKAQ